MKKYLTIGNILLCSAALLALIAFIVGLCAPAISYTVELLGKSSTTTYSGAQVTFGYTAEADTIWGTVSGQIWKFSFMNFLTYLLTLAGIVFAVLAFLGKLDKISTYVAAGCFLVAGVFFFCSVPFTVPAVEKATMEGWALGAGAIVGGIFSILSAACCAVKAFVFKK